MIREVVIIGSGPAGYTAALYTSRAQLDPLVFAGSLSGGQLMLTTDVENYPGFPEGVMGPDLMQDFEKQAVRFGAELRWGSVTHVDFSAHPHKLVVDETTPIGIGDQLGFQHLECHGPVEAGVASAIHHPHAALAKLLIQTKVIET